MPHFQSTNHGPFTLLNAVYSINQYLALSAVRPEILQPSCPNIFEDRAIIHWTDCKYNRTSLLIFSSQQNSEQTEGKVRQVYTSVHRIMQIHTIQSNLLLILSLSYLISYHFLTALLLIKHFSFLSLLFWSFLTQEEVR